MVDPQCKELIKDFEQVCFKEDTMQIDKDRDRLRTHLSDALGYLVWQECREAAKIGPRNGPIVSLLTVDSMENINREHPEYIARKAMWKQYKDLYAGGEQLRLNASRVPGAASEGAGASVRGAAAAGCSTRTTSGRLSTGTRRR